jgi:arginyl-tRNA synthetase
MSSNGCGTIYVSTGENPAKTATVDDDLYTEADRRYNDDPEAEPQCALCLPLDARDPELVKLWEQTRQWSLEGFDQIYKTLGVPFDHYYYESEVEESGKVYVEEMIKKGIARDERPDGAVIVPLDELAGTKEKYGAGDITSEAHRCMPPKTYRCRKNSRFHLDKSVYVTLCGSLIYAANLQDRS